MRTVNMLEAKSSLSRLVDAVESGQESEIVIARNGKPAVRIVALKDKPTGQRLGVARGQFVVPESIDEDNDLIAKLFYGSDE
jgi:prevent-host-death family protein